MITKIKSSRIITENGLLDGFIYFDESGIKEISKFYENADITYDAGNNFVSPGFIDMHVHGALDFDFSDCTANEAAAAVNYHLSHGTTSILPTVTSCEFGTTYSAIENIRECADKNLANANIIGAHLEGPYFSKEMCGAQNPELITPPVKADYTAITEHFGNFVKCWSYAPENDENDEFCKYITRHGIIASAGHSAAEYSDMENAVKAGCSMITHLFCRTSTIKRVSCEKRLGINEAAFLLDSLTAEIIADGKHLPPKLIQMVCKIMGFDRICLVTDALKAAGSSSKTSSVGSTLCIIDDGVCKLCDKSALAGSIATTDRLVRVCVKNCDISVENSVKMAAANPAKILGLNKGLLKQGFDADIAVFDDDINIKKIFVGGKAII